MIVMKFGGTSVEDARSMSMVADIVRRHSSRSPVVVLSAIGGATNVLLGAARLSVEGKLEEAFRSLNGLLERHVALAENFIDDRPTVQQIILECKRRFEELRNLCNAIAVLGETTGRSLDTIASVGEQLSTRIMAEGMRVRGMKTALVDSRSFMITDDHFTSAVPLPDRIAAKCREHLAPLLADGTIPVTQGFIGATASGLTTTLGRGGSDFSASLIGAALDAEEIQIWTDVDGILTADPRTAPGAMLLRDVSFREASELAYFGAKVLHPSTIYPAVEKEIPVVVLNSKRDGSPGTRIVAAPPKSNVPVKSIASKKGITVVNIQSLRMLMAHGFLESIFAVFRKHQTAVDLVSTSEVSVSLTIDSTAALDAIVTDLSAFAEVATYGRKAILCVVGDQMRTTAGVAHDIFLALGDINATMISQGASEINMSVVVDEDRVDEAVRRLHERFFRSNPDERLFAVRKG